jgi:hypothetical protein
LKGVRLPSAQEMQVIKSHPSVLRSPAAEREDAMLRLAAGRYGRFEEKWKMDQNVDAEKVTASYNSGVVEIVVPKKTVRRTPQQAKYQARGQQQRNPFFW